VKQVKITDEYFTKKRIPQGGKECRYLN